MIYVLYCINVTCARVHPLLFIFAGVSSTNPEESGRLYPVYEEEKS